MSPEPPANFNIERDITVAMPMRFLFGVTATRKPVPAALGVKIFTT